MINVAVVGVGGWGINHVRVLRDLMGEGLVKEIVAVDINEARLKAVSRRFSCSYTTNYDDVLKMDSIEGVIISSPTPLHFEHALKAIEHGKHVLVEKPMTSTVSEAIRLIRAAERENVILMVGFIMRYGTGIEYVKREIIEKNVLGRIITISAKRTSFWPNRPMDVGVIRDLAIHDIDVIYYLTKQNAQYVYGVAGMLKHEYEDYAVIMIKYDDMTGIIEANWVTPYKTRTLYITGERASLTLDYMTQEVTLLKEDCVYKPRIRYEEPLLREDRDFITSIIEGKKPLVTGEDGLRALAICEAALKSAVENKIVKVSYYF